METGEPVRRTPEIEEITNLYFIHPIASRLTLLFAKMRLTPNAVSLMGMSFGILAAIAYYRYQDLQCTIAGFILMVVWHVMDGADGQLARLTHSQSQSGKILDGICDYIAFIAVYAALALALSRTWGDWVWALVITAGICHAVQAAAYEVQRQEYDFWGRGQKSAELPGPDALPWSDAGAPQAQRLPVLLYRLYIRLQFRVAGVTVKFRKRLTAAMEREPGRAAFIRRRYREAFAPSVRRWSVMSANYRTVGIFIGALLKAPQYYFLFEIVGFSAILIVLIWRQHARYEMFLDSLDTAD